MQLTDAAQVREASELAGSPSPDFHAAPLDTDLFEWHFTLRGPPSTAYSSGLYHGRILLPPTYPLRPPSFRFLTPSGRFEVNREICLSISGHHEETWQPAWGLRTALVALRAFMGGEARGQVGGMEAGEELRERLARESKNWVCRACGGRRNEEILSGEEEGQLPPGPNAARQETVPEGLRLGYRDELAATANTSSPSSSTSTTPKPESPQSQSQPQPQQQQQPSPTTTPASAPTPSPPRPAPPPSPAWLDPAIYTLAFLLTIMIARKFWSLEVLDDY
jgi:ubiquitin-conjugating enzyme E2 J1